LRDIEKRDICSKNGLTLVEIPYGALEETEVVARTNKALQEAGMLM
jgi:hypothetical protein